MAEYVTSSIINRLVLLVSQALSVSSRVLRAKITSILFLTYLSSRPNRFSGFLLARMAVLIMMLVLGIIGFSILPTI